MSQPKSYLPSQTSPELRSCHLDDEVFGERWPALYQLLSLAQDEKGKAREPASITLFVGEMKLKAIISDKHTKLTFFTTLSDPSDPLGCLDLNVREGRGEWKPMKEGWIKK